MVQIKIISFLDSFIRSLFSEPVKILSEKQYQPGEGIKVEKIKTTTAKKTKTYNRKIGKK
jgi:hypothetical protein